MSNHVELEGAVWGVFAHRFALQTQHGKVLADLGPDALGTIELKEGDHLRVRGEQKRSEIKVDHLVTPDGEAHRIRWPSKHDHAPADPQIAIEAALAAGYRSEGEPRRKPKHWEIASSRDGRAYEVHVELDGKIRKIKELAA